MKLRCLAFAAVILATALAFFDSLAGNSDSDVAIISQYVVSHKRWSPKFFRIERKDCDCAFALYRIIYLPEEGKLPATNSKSFAVHYDEQRHRIVQETRFE